MLINMINEMKFAKGRIQGWTNICNSLAPNSTNFFRWETNKVWKNTKSITNWNKLNICLKKRYSNYGSIPKSKLSCILYISPLYPHSVIADYTPVQHIYKAHLYGTQNWQTLN